MLSMAEPRANILLERRLHRNQLFETQIANTLGDGWMVPFGLALGLNNAEFEPWKEVFFEQDKPMILVEGETDREYLELLRHIQHGANRLKFSGEICPYNGIGNLQNNFVIKFLKERCKKLFVMFDLDVKDDVEPRLTKMGFTANKDFLALGIDAPGKRDIEGLLPESVKGAVRLANPNLVDQLGSADKAERTDAKSRLKKLYLDEFRAKAKFTDEFYKAFYDVAKRINKAMADGD
jgi:putative ATP-dependent endonuclease of OLD family